MKYQSSRVTVLFSQKTCEERFDAHLTVFELTARFARGDRLHGQFDLTGNARLDDFRAVVQRAAGNRNAGGGVPHRFAFDDARRKLQPVHVPVYVFVYVSGATLRVWQLNNES
ncbi:hypothetical protein OKW35_007784 [Paraburkholderia sp. MM5477-R1]